MKSWIEIDAAKLRANYRALCAAAGSGAEALAVIKANAYGHDAVLCGRVLVQAGATWLGVADVEEALRLHAEPEFADTRLLLMSGIDPADAPAVVDHNLTPVVWTLAQIDALENAAAAARKTLAVHLELDTGMARQGAPTTGLGPVLDRLFAASHLRLEGVMTHLVCAESHGSPVTAAQREAFAAAIARLSAAGHHPRYLHILNSSGIDSSGIDEGSTAPWLRELFAAKGVTPMVRAGIALYGYLLPLASPRGDQHEHAGTSLAPRIQPILTWKTRVLDTRTVPAGATIGYSATFTAPHPMTIALLPTGYADGFRRSASSGPAPEWLRGWVMIHGRRAPVVGRVSMNLTTVDVTGIENVHPGDEVVLLGEGVTADDHAAWSGTISYEILCGIRAHPHLV